MKTIRTWLTDKNGEIVSGGEEAIKVWKESANSRIWIDVQTQEVEVAEQLLVSLD